MVERARKRLVHAARGTVSFIERTASEIDALPPASFDAVVACLSLSEMSRQERSFILKWAMHALRPGGVLAIADEVRSHRLINCILQKLVRGPQAALSWIIAGSVSHPIPDLAEEANAAGFAIRTERRWLFETLQQ
jgi:demethylmenaquinone methyltransferase/2-methoxy-6-polyprenyl-1,4-benzoquinol methylase